MITREEARKYVKEFTPNAEIINAVEKQIKEGNKHIRVYTTRFVRTYAEDCAAYFRNLGYEASIEDIYNQRTWQRGGNYLKIEL